MDLRIFRTARGWVADYCPLCRDVQAMELIYLHDTLQPMPRLCTVCSACGVRFNADVSRYVSIPPKRPADLAELVKQSNPRLPWFIAGRVAWDRRAVTGRLEAPERAYELREPIQILTYLLPRPINYTAVLILAILSGFAVSGATVTVLKSFPAGTRALNWWTEDRTFAVLCTVVFAAALVCIPLGWARWRRLIFRRRIEGRMARGLRPLRPSEAELKALGDWLDMAWHPMRKMFSAPRLHNAVRSLRDESLTNVDELRFDEQVAQFREQVLTQAADSGCDPELHDPDDADDLERGGQDGLGEAAR